MNFTDDEMRIIALSLEHRKSYFKMKMNNPRYSSITFKTALEKYREAGELLQRIIENYENLGIVAN